MTGIVALGTAIPTLSLDVAELARLRGVDPDKYRIGLGCRSIALCAHDEGVVELAVRAARRALDSWGGSLEEIGMVAVGTETALDMSRPLSAFVAEALGLAGHIRSYEVKHACYGGTLALRQACEWRRSGAARGKSALVIAADVSLYAPGHPGEPTEGAGAVAMIVGDGSLVEVGPYSYAFSEPAFDFWRPVGEPYPRVQGKLSLDCYKKAVVSCFEQWRADNDAAFTIEETDAFVFHTPFPKMVKKAFLHVGGALGWTDVEANDRYANQVEPGMEWNRVTGNSYTASLWLGVAKVLSESAPGTRIAAFSYGSGYGAELLLLTAGDIGEAQWRVDMRTDLATRTALDAASYDRLRTAPTAVAAE